MNIGRRIAATTVPALATGSLLMPATASADTGPDPSQVSVTGVTYSGSGCPTSGSVTGPTFSPDDGQLTIGYRDMAIAFVPTTPADKGCEVDFTVNAPADWRFDVGGVAEQDNVSLTPGAVADETDTVSLTGNETGVVAASHETVGPAQTSNGSTVSDNVGLNSLVWSPCGANVPLNMKSMANVTGAGGSDLAADSTDGKFNTVLSFQWKKC